MNEVHTNRALNRALLARQGLLERQAGSCVRMVEQLGGMQAQQARPPFAGLWSRLTNLDRGELTKAIEQRQLVRALFWRGTLHLVSTRDYLAWRETLQKMLTSGMQAILGDRAATFDKDRVLDAAAGLFAAHSRTFTELRRALIELFPGADERAMGYFVRTHLHLISVPESGSPWAFPGDCEFALIEKAAPKKATSPIERYLAAFGPATVADFQAWSGFKGAQPLFEKAELVTFTDERKRTLYDIPEAPRPDPATPAPVRFIAEFDNLVLGHADRTRIIADEHRPKITTKNLLVPGTILVDGFVSGTWKCERKKKDATLVIAPFLKLPAGVKRELTEEGERFVRFLEPDSTNRSVTFA
jgi:hypothetical protein